ncbi:MAG: PASTA domain-containing protein [Bacteroidota bacterium]
MMNLRGTVVRSIRYFATEIYGLLTNRTFLLNLLGIFVFVALVLWGVMTWLKVYTHHGQQIEMPNYIGAPISESELSARERKFEIIVNDSVHIVGKPGGLIHNQTPRPGAYVKEGRKIYVTTTKYNADLIDISNLRLYGQGYEMTKSSLERKGFKTEIKDYRYDHLTNNAILEVWQDNRLLVSRTTNPDKVQLEKGSTLSFVISTPEGGSEVVENLVGRTVNTARFLHQYLRLDIVNRDDIVGFDIEKCEIVSQNPNADGLTSLSHGSTIAVTVRKP